MTAPVLDRLVALELADAPASAAAERERQVAVRDLLEDNSFALPPRDGRAVAGPFRLRLAVRDRRLVFAVDGAAGFAAEFHLSLGPFRQVVKDYVQIIQSLDEAVTAASPARVEAIDMARRGIHDEGARVLAERLDGKASFDRATARRLFTLICALHPDGPGSGGPGPGGSGA